MGGLEFGLSLRQEGAVYRRQAKRCRPPKDVTIALELAKKDEDRALVGKQGGSFAFLGLDTTDCMADYNRMKALDVKFQGEPTSGPWGTGVLFEDLYGNKIFMSQEPQQ